jgi:hypothetical protein
LDHASGSRGAENAEPDSPNTRSPALMPVPKSKPKPGKDVNPNSWWNHQNEDPPSKPYSAATTLELAFL